MQLSLKPPAHKDDMEMEDDMACEAVVRNPVEGGRWDLIVDNDRVLRKLASKPFKHVGLQSIN